MTECRIQNELNIINNLREKTYFDVPGHNKFNVSETLKQLWPVLWATALQGPLPEVEVRGLVSRFSWPHRLSCAAGRQSSEAFFLESDLEQDVSLSKWCGSQDLHKMFVLRWSWCVIDPIICKRFSMGDFRSLDGCSQNMNHDHVGTLVIPIWPWR